ncbi:hypothetical protein NDA14_001856 [Ustilago hordei]|nr:hypothetical protein NDA10_002650 [Ustilago hordei]KAJ1596615.1 hypothetical protein NDA14_001856 [Ustilago hordei]
MLWTFGCLTWVNIPQAKCKKLDEPANLVIFVGYDEEHKGWKFLTPNHNPPVFWSNLAHFLQDKSWNNCTDTTQIQDMDALHYNTGTDIKDFSYSDIDTHDEDLQQPLDEIYCLAPEQDMAFKGEISPPELANDTLRHPDPPGPADTTHEHPDNKPDEELGTCILIQDAARLTTAAEGPHSPCPKLCFLQILVNTKCPNQINEMKKAIIDKWKITDNRPATKFLKIKIMWD